MEILVCMPWIPAAESADRARWAVGVEILYGALVLVSTWMSGGWAIAIPSLKFLVLAFFLVGMEYEEGIRNSSPNCCKTEALAECLEHADVCILVH